MQIKVKDLFDSIEWESLVIQDNHNNVFEQEYINSREIFHYNQHKFNYIDDLLDLFKEFDVVDFKAFKTNRGNLHLRITLNVEDCKKVKETLFTSYKFLYAGEELSYLQQEIEWHKKQLEEKNKLLATWVENDETEKV